MNKHWHYRVIKIFMLIFFIVMTISLTSCAKYKSYTKMNHIYQEEIFTVGEGLTKGHYVFFYRSDCQYCKKAESAVVAYGNAAAKDKSLSPIYVLNRDDKQRNGGLDKGAACQDSDNKNTHLGKTSYEEIKLCSSPCLIYIVDGKVTKAWDSANGIIEALEALI